MTTRQIVRQAANIMLLHLVVIGIGGGRGYLPHPDLVRGGVPTLGYLPSWPGRGEGVPTLGYPFPPDTHLWKHYLLHPRMREVNICSIYLIWQIKSYFKFLGHNGSLNSNCFIFSTIAFNDKNSIGNCNFCSKVESLIWNVLNGHWIHWIPWYTALI